MNVLEIILAIIFAPLAILLVLSLAIVAGFVVVAGLLTSLVTVLLDIITTPAGFVIFLIIMLLILFA